MIEDLLFLHDYVPNTGEIVVELGAGPPCYTPRLAELVGPQGIVLAVEAHPKAADTLRQQVSLYPWVQVIEAIVVGEQLQPFLTFENGPSATNRVLPDGELTLPTVSLDDLTESLERIDYLKINIEGGEISVITGSPQSLAKTKHLVVSCHDFIGTPSKQVVLKSLQEQGFFLREHSNPLIYGEEARTCVGDYLYGFRGTTEACK